MLKSWRTAASGNFELKNIISERLQFWISVSSLTRNKGKTLYTDPSVLVFQSKEVWWRWLEWKEISTLDKKAKNCKLFSFSPQSNNPATKSRIYNLEKPSSDLSCVRHLTCQSLPSIGGPPTRAGDGPLLASNHFESVKTMAMLIPLRPRSNKHRTRQVSSATAPQHLVL